ncbi:hypothetical protein BC936DRAFT_139153 [Jimgerdemannia flammicorona]|uniref:Protein kinase domain-containing protein n=2 Tax=Jimgerdemannia flammicorona TaxID=994334 RepID=A0A433BAJ5_9FUNG|nr:hypothetical protein BC936DRAFT_139153 [Jimgerdemannia flammicorona]
MSTVRSAYQRAFRSLFLSALDSIREDPMISEPSHLLITPAPTNTSPDTGPSGTSGSYFPDFRLAPTNSSVPARTVIPTSTWPASLTFEHILNVEDSRYLTDFSETGLIGKGGFASVWRARNKLDGIEYAVKKVRLGSADFDGARGKAKNAYDKVFREIKGLARLEHTNVVRYYGSWLEYVAYTPKSANQRGRELHAHTMTDTMTETGDSDEKMDDLNSEFSDNKPRAGAVNSYSGVGTIDDGMMHGLQFDFELADDMAWNREENSYSGVGFMEESAVDENLSIVPKAIPAKSKRPDSSFAIGNGDSTSPVPTTASGSSGKKILSTSLEDDTDEDEVEEIRRRGNTPSPATNGGWSTRKSVRDYFSFSAAMEPRNLMLFIQMQLCFSTLHDYISSRNVEVTRLGEHEGSLDARVNLNLFRGVVRGVAYIHDQGLIHRDLKPSNIFLSVVPDNAVAERDETEANSSGDWEAGARQHEKLTVAFVSENLDRVVPRIGDFGLVTNMEQEVADAEAAWRAASARPSPREPCRCEKSARCAGDRSCPSSRSYPTSYGKTKSTSTRTTGVGTVTYASPEQLANPPCPYNEKSDVYSLGIILFELFYPFATAMERAQALRGLRRGVLPERFVQRWPKESALILWMMAEDPAQRPSAKQLLEIELLTSPDDYTDVDLRARLHEKSRALDAKTKEAEELKRKVEELEKRLQRMEVWDADMANDEMGVGQKSRAGSKKIDDEKEGMINPLPGFLDPLTLEEAVNPAISKYGHVMGCALPEELEGEEKIPVH